jgi:hypothetical protein
LENLRLSEGLISSVAVKASPRGGRKIVKSTSRAHAHPD